jgi:DNA-binding beta-propeller fold protein YncE
MEIQFAVVIGLKAYDALEFIKGLPSGDGCAGDYEVQPVVTIGDGTAGFGENQLNDPNGVAFVPTHPELIIVTTRASQSLRVYHLQTKKLLCKLGKGAFGQSGSGPGQFCDPYGVVVSADASHVVVADHQNDRVQVEANKTLPQPPLLKNCSTCFLTGFPAAGRCRCPNAENSRS